MSTRREPPGGWAAHEGLVGKVAHRYVRAVPRLYHELEDLMAAGRMGLLRAAETWDPERGAWSTYALPWVRNAISRHIQNYTRLVRIPVHELVKRQRGGTLQRERTVRLDAPAPGFDSDAHALHEAFRDHDAVDPELHALERDECAELDAAMADLPERHRTVLRHRMRDRSLIEIGEELGLSRERIRQIEIEAVQYLRAALAGDHGKARAQRRAWRRNSVRRRAA